MILLKVDLSFIIACFIGGIMNFYKRTIISIATLLVIFLSYTACYAEVNSERTSLLKQCKSVYKKAASVALFKLDQLDKVELSELCKTISNQQDLSNQITSFDSRETILFVKNKIKKELGLAYKRLEICLSQLNDPSLTKFQRDLEALREHSESSQQSSPPFCPYLSKVLEYRSSNKSIEFLRSFFIIEEFLAQKSHFISPRPKSVSNNKSAFYKWADIKKIIDRAAQKNPSIIRLYSLGKTLEGRDIPLIKISDNPGIDENEPEILFTSGMHPREQQPQVCLLAFMNDLVNGYGKDPQITKLVNEREIWLVPVFNVDGKIHDFHRGTKKGLRNNWRKNRRLNPDKTRGVDLNRNFPVRWVRTTNNGFLEDYPGSGPASEPETQALMKFIASRPLSFYTDIHSYMGATIVPKYLSIPEATIYSKLLHDISKLQKKPYFYKEPTGGEIPVANPRKGAGLGFVWAYCAQGVRSMNIEVRGPGFYESIDKSMQEYSDNIKKPLLYLADTCKNFKPCTKGQLTLIDYKSDKPIVPGCSIILKTVISGKFNNAVLVSHSPRIRVLSEYRHKPETNGFNLTVMRSAKHGMKVPMTLYVWENNRARSVINFNLRVR